MKRFLLISFLCLVSAFAFTPPARTSDPLPIYTTSVTAAPTPIGGTQFHIGITIGGVIHRYTVTFYVSADPTPTPTPKPTPTPTPTPKPSATP